MAPEHQLESIDSLTADNAASTLDLEAVIARFAGDDSRVSYALPASLSPEQRQLAKKLVGHHPHLDCESYGFGPERQLHLFKRRAGNGRLRMRVKNTFIDAWLDNGEGKLGNTPVFRSLPSDWRRSVVAALVAPISNVQSDVPDENRNENQVCSTPSPNSSPKSRHCPSALIPAEFDDVPDTCAVQVVCSTPSSPMSSCTSPAALATAEAPSLVEARDPHGTELTTSHGTGACSDCCVVHMSAAKRLATSPPPVSPCNVAMLTIGTKVEIDGLLQRPDFNGLFGIVQSWDPMLRRYEVLLDWPSGRTGPRLVKTKRENLRLRPPPPPASAAGGVVATLDLSTCLLAGSEDSFTNSGGDLNALVIDASPSMSDNSGWFQWQICDPTTSPTDSATMLASESYVSSETGWEFSTNLIHFDESISYEASDCSTWLQSPCCETQGWGQT